MPAYVVLQLNCCLAAATCSNSMRFWLDYWIIPKTTRLQVFAHSCNKESVTEEEGWLGQSQLRRSGKRVDKSTGLQFWNLSSLKRVSNSNHLTLHYFFCIYLQCFSGPTSTGGICSVGHLTCKRLAAFSRPVGSLRRESGN